ncbi:MAG: trypsin-like peptidase domain-containing protein [Clostridia bacterium]|nr:trypsin-like peptidase domain-containing protein [Clostridia bacterium]
MNENKKDINGVGTEEEKAEDVKDTEAVNEADEIKEDTQTASLEDTEADETPKDSADTESTQKQESPTEYTVARREYSPVSGESEYARWSYIEQSARDKKAQKKSNGRGALVFTAVMSAAFSAAIVALILALVFGNALYRPEKVVYEEKIIYVREDGKTSGSLSIPEISEKLDPSIVFIDVETQNGGGTATGIVLTADGYIITNAHVIEDAVKITAIFNDKTEYEATLCGADEVADLAVIKVTPSSPLIPAEIGSSEDLLVGESVVAIGCPAGYTATTTEGIVSAVNREIEIFDSDGRIEKTMTLLQTNANINPGNSGGALLDMDGKVIGITTLKLVESGAGINYDGLGFAIPITPAMDIIEVLKTGGESYGGSVASKTPSLGVTGTIVKKGVLNPSTNEKSPADGFYVSEVAAGSSADGIIKAGDIIVLFDGKPIDDIEVVRDILKQKKAGDKVTAVVYRDGSETTLTITLK